MTKQRLDIALTKRGLVTSRSQAESWIKLGKVTVDGHVVTKSGIFVNENADIKLLAEDQYVSRAGLKLASVAKVLKLDFKDKIVLDVGSSTGGFTDFALQNGAKKVIAVDVGTNQLHPSLRGDARIELHEKTDIRDVLYGGPVVPSAPENFCQGKTFSGAAPRNATPVLVPELPNIVVIDVSFISLREILPHIHDNLSDKNTQIVAMVKPQFEVYAEHGRSTGKYDDPSTSSGFRNQRLLSKGIVKNDAMRRQILKDFEDWSRKYFVIVSKRDSDVAGAKGNQERFYLLKST